VIGVGDWLGCEGVPEPQPASALIRAAVRMKGAILI
jgi:hypothetical protein